MLCVGVVIGSRDPFQYSNEDKGKKSTARDKERAERGILGPGQKSAQSAYPTYRVYSERQSEVLCRMPSLERFVLPTPNTHGCDFLF